MQPNAPLILNTTDILRYKESVNKLGIFAFRILGRNYSFAYYNQNIDRDVNRLKSELNDLKKTKWKQKNKEILRVTDAYGVSTRTVSNYFRDCNIFVFRIGFLNFSLFEVEPEISSKQKFIEHEINSIETRKLSRDDMVLRYKKIEIILRNEDINEHSSYFLNKIKSIVKESK